MNVAQVFIQGNIPRDTNGYRNVSLYCGSSSELITLTKRNAIRSNLGENYPKWELPLGQDKNRIFVIILSVILQRTKKSCVISNEGRCWAKLKGVVGV